MSSTQQVIIPNTAERTVYVRLMPFDPANGITVQRHVISSAAGGKGDLFEEGKWYPKPRSFGEHAERFQRQNANNPRSARLFQIAWTKQEWEDVVRAERRRALGMDKIARSSEQSLIEAAPPIETGHQGVMDPSSVDLRLPPKQQAAAMPTLFGDEDEQPTISPDQVDLEQPINGRGDLRLSDLPTSENTRKKPETKAATPKAPAKKTTLVGQRSAKK